MFDRCALNGMCAECASGMVEGERPAGSTSYVDSTSSSESEDGDGSLCKTGNGRF